MWRRSHRTLSTVVASLLIQCLRYALLVDATPASTCPAQHDSLPDFVLEYAPLIYLHSEDPYMPSAFATLLENSIPTINYTPVADVPSPLTLGNLDSLNILGGEDIFLTSKEGIRALPEWFRGTRPDRTGKTVDAVSSVIVVRDHGDGKTVDVFYFYYFAYNQGNTVIGIQFGNHVGDWEHNMIRFENGAPQAIWYSQHSAGQAFTYEATEKQGLRPVGYSSNGSHAVYSTPGTHDHTIPGFNLPGGLLEDETDRGVLWDPLLSAYAYSYDNATEIFTPYDASTPTSYLYFDGRWGDQQLPDDAEGQIVLFGQRKYVSAPNGVKFKRLVREEVCPGDGECVIYDEVRVKRRGV
ncbi:uncharacterized protein BDCG_06232 [Blastomyces dermatitidis ER-3]|uniref:Vacuolar protein sorting-associated protein 62 n=6 Tax=Blastomyces TaxID=229219 RepID=A0A179U8X5_BLAGS|nr:uncharacterized protein BDBG_00797 [Blastomyces gilchristii SLH14081]XP_045277709.1 uncharacterized protein BDCG_06232 [Blastomyces dermatitidis ER-3]EGE82751.1 vacuolar protein sorting-associated protein 62 [Blastomyces dermatitidis ATCC 18188]EQL29227.1 hypothetical protein BDFG_08133 [Blastomyces dermatitidis ATCC 26199]EEQ91112.1 hypothetical protein BDCG_06232 [Blastomyces dermatitidis ER-3]OAT04183.1 hypothetical protein BDBG_00797 [Blastomyces gilchristii SLH14081]